MSSPKYELFEAIIGILHTVFLAVTMIGESKGSGETVENLQEIIYGYTAFNLFFTTQMLLKIMAFGKEIFFTFKLQVEFVA